MSGDGHSRGDVLSRCSNCGSTHDPEDNYCRHCGAALHGTSVPMVRDGDSYAPAPWRGTLPVAVRGAAVVAAGTLAEAVLRRLIGRALRRSARPTSRPGKQTHLPSRQQEKAELLEDSEPEYGEDHIVTETFLFRRVRLRRQG
jgi:hypothetical protein